MYKISIYNNNVEILINYPTTDPGAPHISDMKLNETENQSIIFGFKIFTNNPGYDQLVDLVTTIKIIDTRNDTLKFEGRILVSIPSMDESGIFYKDVACESDLGYLNDSRVGRWELHPSDLPTDAPSYAEPNHTMQTAIQKILDNHNSNVNTEKQFVLGTVGSTDHIYMATNYESSLDALLNKLVTDNNLIIKIRKENGLRYLDVLLDNPSVSTTKIQLRKNLKTFKKTPSYNDFCTRLIGIGAEGITFEDINSGKNYVEDLTAISEYGIITKVCEFQDITIKENLLVKTTQKLAEILNDSYTSIEVSALDLSYIGLDVEDFKVGVKYPIENDVQNYSNTLKLVSMDLDLSQPWNSTLTFSNFPATSTLNTKNMQQQLNSSRVEMLTYNGHIMQKVTSADGRFESYREQTDQAILERVTNEAFESYEIQTAEEIASKVSSSEFGSLIEQHPNSVKMAVGPIGCNNLLKHTDFSDCIPNSTDISGWSKWGSFFVYGGQGTPPYNSPGTLYMANDTSNSSGIHQDVYAPKTNFKYVLAFGMTKESNVLGPDVRIEYYDSNWNLINSLSLSSILVLDGSRTAYKFTTPSSFAHMRVVFEHSGNSNPGAGNYLLGITYPKLEEGENATGWSPDPRDSVDYTTAQVDILNDEINLKVSSNEFGSLIEAHPDSVRIAVGQVGGRNLLRNAGFRNGLTSWSPERWRGSESWGYGVWYNNADWTLKDGDCDDVSGYIGSSAWVRADETVEGANMGHGMRQWVKVLPNKTYTISGLFGLHRCNIVAEIQACDINNNRLGTTIDGTLINNGAGMGGSTETGWYHYKKTFTTPSNCYSVEFFPYMTQHVGGGTDSYLFYDRFQIEEGENQTAWRPNADEVKTTDVTVDENGLTVNNAAVIVKNGNNTVIIDGTHNMHKIVQSETVHISGTDHNITNTAEIFHNLNYVPAISGYQMQNGETNATQTPAFTLSSGTGSIGILSVIRLRADTTKLYIDFVRENNKSNEASYDFYVRYYIYVEAGI